MWEHTERQEYSIAVGDKLYVYQRVFTGPGLYFMLDTTTVTSQETEPADDKDVDIVVVSAPRRFIQYMDVAYGDKESDAPEDRVRTLQRASEDINHGFGGKYVWMVPYWTFDADRAATSFDIFIQKDRNPAWKDLAKGADGDFRYVYSNHDDYQTRKVVGAKLIRSPKALSDTQQANMLGNGW